MPVPDPATQQAIAAYLDRETGRIDALVAAKRRMVGLLEERWNTLARLTLRGDTSHSGGRWSPGPHWLGSVPKKWLPRKIAWVKDVGSGTTPSSDFSPYYAERDGVPWVTTTELREAPIIETTKYVTARALRDYSSLRIFPPGTLLIAMYGATIGRLGMLSVEATVNQACCAISGDGELDQNFLYWWLRTFRSNIVTMAQGAGQPNISQEVIRSLRVPAPLLEEQRQIANSLASDWESVAEISQKLQRQASLLKERRQALITAAVTGQLDIQEAA
jgi:type I restriction enzyme S subunit